jgi:hypothetical protein
MRLRSNSKKKFNRASSEDKDQIQEDEKNKVQRQSRTVQKNKDESFKCGV